MAERWRELHGEKNWEGLLDPIDVDLRHTIILYGEMVMCTYQSFIGEKRSKNVGTCRFARREFLKKNEVSHPDWYKVTKYIYATSRADGPGRFILKSLSREEQPVESNWMGYIAVATDDGVDNLGRRDIVIAWRGTQQGLEWVDDLEFSHAHCDELLGPHASDGHPKVHQGYLSVYTASDDRLEWSKQSARQQVVEEVERLVEHYAREDVSITVCGHSLGATLATITAIDLVANGINIPKSHPENQIPVTAFVFGSPKVGNGDFKELFDKLPGLHQLRVRNAPDRIPIYPPLGYHDIGVELFVDSRKSPFLKPHENESVSHDLEVHMHTIAGWQGPNRDFHLVVDRDIALVNKYDDCLTDEHPVPPGWKVSNNKNMKRDPHTGRWLLDDREGDYDDEEYL